ncbi:LOW QUALITY PROTEIN: hypothetical protein HID58_038112 [Brassica napus]|uniref:Uncharacterized protein n=1 Tax=Brassica napus TaxID=3708 RepID=A0ABQ8BNB1_BRANA|nr:LOW QUALITY PROTEIN: hypothetical protein HID58_038112 [Brassica napus]
MVMLRRGCGVQIGGFDSELRRVVLLPLCFLHSSGELKFVSLLRCRFCFICLGNELHKASGQNPWFSGEFQENSNGDPRDGNSLIVVAYYLKENLNDIEREESKLVTRN